MTEHLKRPRRRGPWIRQPLDSRLSAICVEPLKVFLAIDTWDYYCASRILWVIPIPFVDIISYGHLGLLLLMDPITCVLPWTCLTVSINLLHVF
jgi:hypothetical protein